MVSTTTSMSLNFNGIHLSLFPANKLSSVPPPSYYHNHKTNCRSCLLSSSGKTKSSLLSNAFSLGVAVSLITLTPSPASGIPSLFSRSPATIDSPSTPFSESKNLPTGLENGKIRPCPSTNPGCVSTNPQSSSFSFPWIIPESSLQDAIKDLEEAIVATQKNVKVEAMDDTPNGKYLQVEVDGGFGRDVMEFLVKKDTVLYRTMATKVNYIYPFTTAFGDSKGQEERLQKILEKLGWYATTPDLTE